MNNCVSCGAVIPEGRQVCPACEVSSKKPMKWAQVGHCDWEAKGSAGDFRVWKDGKVWKSRYRSTDKTRLFFLPIKRNLKEAKAMCEDNFYWED